MSDTQSTFCGVLTPTGKTVYAGPRTREEFDRLPLTAKEYDWVPCEVATLCARDGRQWERRVTSKCLEDAITGITVIFQWHDTRPIETADSPAEDVQAVPA